MAFSEEIIVRAEEYKELVKASVQIEIIKGILAKEVFYANKDMLMSVLGVSSAKEEKKEEGVKEDGEN